jgi:hypothetical protein
MKKLLSMSNGELERHADVPTLRMGFHVQASKPSN